MDLKELSSNWKKLQATLKNNTPSTASKRSASSLDRQDGVKRIKKSTSSRHIQTNSPTEKRGPLLKKRKMSKEITNGVERLTVNGEADTKESSIIRPTEKDIGRERVNEGLSAEYVSFFHCSFAVK